MNICRCCPGEPHNVEILIKDVGRQDEEGKSALMYVFDDSIVGKQDRLKSLNLEESALLTRLVEYEAGLKSKEGRTALAYLLNSKQYNNEMKERLAKCDFFKALLKAELSMLKDKDVREHEYNQLLQLIE